MSHMHNYNLKPGDLIIATKDARYPAHISPERHFSQRKGQILMVNNPRHPDTVGGTFLTGTSHEGRSSIGLGGSFKTGTFRRATPHDPGFLGTREQWESVKDDEIRALRRQNRILKITLVLLGAVSTIACGVNLLALYPL